MEPVKNHEFNYLIFLLHFQFNIAIQDHPDVLAETKKALQISQSDTITNRLPLCVEISLQTVDGDKMILEVWSLNINTELSDPQIKATSFTVYNRMSILLKSLISITRVTPAYKLSRRQSPESYSIYYRIYSGEPQHNLGELSSDEKKKKNNQILQPQATTLMQLLHLATKRKSI